MATRCALVLLSILCVGHLVTNGLLTQMLDRRQEKQTEIEVTLLKRERGLLAGDRVRMEGQIRLLAAAVARLDRSLASRGTPAINQASAAREPLAVDDPELTEHLRREGMETKPNPLAMSILSEDEMQRLSSYCQQFPVLDFAMLREGDIDALLADPRWVSEADREVARDLGAEDLKQLRGLVSEYRYFSKFSCFERFRAMVAPELPKLKAEGAYVEFEGKDGAPTADGIRVAHAEQIEGEPSRFRLYQFHADDYPAIYHHETVSQQRSLEAMARIYAFLYDRESASIGSSE